MRIIIIDEADVNPSLDTAIKKTLVTCFPHNESVFSKTRRWRDNKPVYNVVALDEECVCGHVAVVDRTIRVGEKLLRVAGVGNVCALPEHRKTGLSDVLLKTSMKEAAERNFEFGLLFTNQNIKEFYARNGWVEISHRKFIRIENTDEIILPDESIKMCCHLVGREFPEGDVQLQGDKW